MSWPHPVTEWINQLKAGDAEAAQRLWEVYFQRMVQLARRKLNHAPRASADEEDVALSAFKSFCLGAREGRFTQLLDSDNLWPLLMAITLHKSVDLIRGENRQKRGGPGQAAPARTAPELAEIENSSVSSIRPIPVPLSDIISREPTPEFAAEMTEQLHILLARLDSTGDPDLQRIALLKLDGYNTSEIAERIGCAKRTIERKTNLIERLWKRDIEL